MNRRHFFSWVGAGLAALTIPSLSKAPPRSLDVRDLKNGGVITLDGSPDLSGVAADGTYVISPFTGAPVNFCSDAGTTQTLDVTTDIRHFTCRSDAVTVAGKIPPGAGINWAIGRKHI